MQRGPRVKNLLRGLLNLLALVLVAGGVGVALGMGLSALSGGEQPATTGVGGGSTTASEAVGEPPAPTSTSAFAPVETTTAPAATTTTAPQAAPEPEPEPVSASVLDARVFTDATPSGRQEQRARVTVRVRAENAGDERATLDPPVLRVGSVRIPVDPASARFEPLEPGTNQTVTLRFALAGEATPKVVRDRRARILVAGQSLAIRVKVQAPSQ